MAGKRIGILTGGGDVPGLNMVIKSVVQRGAEHDCQVIGIRRGWDHPVPGGETLKTVYERAVPFYQNEVVPQLMAGKNVLVVAHGNTLRSLMKYIETISDEGVESLEMPFGNIIAYDVDPEGHMLAKDDTHIDSAPPNA